MSRERARGLAAVLAATLVGALLRLRGLGAQILIDDEFHAFRAGLRRDLDAIYLLRANTLPEDPLSDYSSPLALWVRLLADSVGIDEWGLRAPMVIASIAIIPLLGLRARKIAGGGAGALAAWLAALSPLLAMYGRVARPYSLVALCGCVALLAASSLRERASLRAAAMLGSSTSLGIWFNASAAPALMLWLGLGCANGLRSSASAGARRAALTALAFAGSISVALLAPALPALGAFAAAKSGSSPGSWSAWWGAMRALAGVSGELPDLAAAAVVGLFAAAIAAGAVAWMRRAPALVVLALSGAAAQLGAFLWTRPYGADDPLVIARYSIAVLPGFLLLAAAGLDAQAARLRAPLAAAAMLALALVGWLAAGPFVRDYARENAYTSRPSSLARAAYTIAPDMIPAVYARIDASMSIVEIPWVLEWPLALPADYQAIHGARVRAATGFWAFHEPGVRLRTIARVVGGALDIANVDAVIVHRDLVEEWKYVARAPLTIAPDRLEDAARRYRLDAEVLERAIVESGAFELASEDRFARLYVPRARAASR